MKTIGILINGFPPTELQAHFPNYGEMLQQLLIDNTKTHFKFKFYNAYLTELPARFDECDSWMITGSACGVYDQLDWIQQEIQFIQSLWQYKIPLFGVCFGHQIIAQALGGQVEKAAQGWGIGLHHYTANKPLPWQSHSKPSIQLYAMHQDQVLTKPAEADCVFHSEFCPYAALSYGDSIFTLQPHPEFSYDFEKALIELRRGDRIPTRLADDALATMNKQSAVADSSFIASHIAQLFTR